MPNQHSFPYPSLDTVSLCCLSFVFKLRFYAHAGHWLTVPYPVLSSSMYPDGQSSYNVTRLILKDVYDLVGVFRGVQPDLVVNMNFYIAE